MPISDPTRGQALPLAVVYRLLNELKLNSRNPRKHSKAQVRQLARSISVFGFNVPILVDENSTVIAGHGRVFAAQLNGLQQVPTIMLPHLTAEQLIAFNIADNKLVDNSEWDEPLLAEIFLELSALNINLEDTAFSVSEIDLRIEGISVSAHAADEIDKLPEWSNTTPISVLGDLWQLGKHRLLCGNALEGPSYSALMNSMQAAMAFADVPYNMKSENIGGLGATQHRDFVMASGEMDDDEFLAFLTTSCMLMAEHGIDGALFYVCIDWRNIGALLEAGKKAFTELKNICAWVKDNGGMGSLYRSQHELIPVFKKGHTSHRNNVMLGKHGRYRTNVWNYPGANSFSRNSEEGNLLALHPTVKPVALVMDAILDCTTRGDIVLDPFLGSGTTLMAAERVGRTCYGMELDPLYVDVIIRRWQKYTGGEARHAVSGRIFNDIAGEKEASHDR
jgi:DNA modification methylase